MKAGGKLEGKENRQKMPKAGVGNQRYLFKAHMVAI